MQNGLTKIYKQGLKMKKNYKGYIESEDCGQILILCIQMCHRKVFSLQGVYKKWLQTENFLQNGLTKIYKLMLTMKKNYKGNIESEGCSQVLYSLYPTVTEVFSLPGVYQKSL